MRGGCARPHGTDRPFGAFNHRSKTISRAVRHLFTGHIARAGKSTPGDLFQREVKISASVAPCALSNQGRVPI